MKALFGGASAGGGAGGDVWPVVSLFELLGASRISSPDDSFVPKEQVIFNQSNAYFFQIFVSSLSLELDLIMLA